MECVAVFFSNQQHQLLPRQPGLCGSNAWRTAESRIRKEAIGRRRDGKKIIDAAYAAYRTLNPSPPESRFSLRVHDLCLPIPRPPLSWTEEAQQHISRHSRRSKVGLPVHISGESAVSSSLDGPPTGTPPPPPPPQPQRATGSTQGSLKGRVVAFTTPRQYATRLEALLRDEGAEPLWCPTIATEQSEQTQKEVENLLWDQQAMTEVHGVAFTSRAGIKAFADALKGRQLPLRKGDRAEDSSSCPFVVAALGKDAELLQELGLIAISPGVGVSLVVPAVSTPQALVEALGEGGGRKLMCPVPLVEEGLQEPPVVPDFLAGLKRRGWDPIRVNSYVTRWLGLDCAQQLLLAASNEGEAFAQENSPQFVFKPIDALIFTSTAEIEGLLKSLHGLGHDGALIRALQRGARQFLIASHGPVTALGAERLGLQVDVVGKAFQSFDGIVQALRTELDSIGHDLLTRS